MNKMIIVLINLFSFSLVTSLITYRPMSKKTIDFGEDVCYYEDKADSTGIVYVKPCQEGKRCKDLGISDYNIHTCVAYDNEYDNRNADCVTKDNYDSSGYGNGIDCTGYSCQNDKCAGTCSETQVKNLDDSNACVADPGFCYEYDSSGNPDKRYTPAPGKECVRFELQSSNQKTYTTKKLYSNDFASIEDGQFIQDSQNYLIYCSSGYALYFYGDKKLKNPNTDAPTNHQMYLMCVTVLGRDSKGIIKYSINGGAENYYDPSKLPSKSSGVQYSLYYNDDLLMERLEIFNEFKNSLNDPNESIKWKYFYHNPEKYLLYKNEPQIIEYLIKEKGRNYDYKPKLSSSNSSVLNMKYLTLLLLIFLF